MLNDTIAAIATPLGEGGLAVIRISGPQALAVSDRCFVPAGAGSAKPSAAATHTIHFGHVVHEGQNIDEALVAVMRAPRTFTREDVVEITCHGGVLAAKTVLDAVLKSGTRLAEPGEFTRRAFLNGRIDLAQAEAVADLIHSRTELALRAANEQLAGSLSRRINQLRDEMVETLAHIEAHIDFPEEDIAPDTRGQLVARLDNGVDFMDELLRTANEGQILRRGIRAAIVGRPNSGKSSLLNQLLGHDRAIVSPIPGTTRDVIREEVSINGILFRLFDTAGIRATVDAIEKEGVFRSRDAVKNADVVLFINDVEQKFPDELYTELLELSSKEKIITVFNKADLPHQEEKEGIFVSAKTGEGIDSLFTRLKVAALGSNFYTEQTAIVSNARHYDSLRKSKENLEAALDSINAKMSGEFISVGLRTAESSLSEIIGIVTSDDILNNIFSKFCIGK